MLKLARKEIVCWPPPPQKKFAHMAKSLFGRKKFPQKEKLLTKMQR